MLFALLFPLTQRGTEGQAANELKIGDGDGCFWSGVRKTTRFSPSVYPPSCLPYFRIDPESPLHPESDPSMSVRNGALRLRSGRSGMTRVSAL